MARTQQPEHNVSAIAANVAEISGERFSKREQKEVSVNTLASSGSTLLNLACTDNPYGAYMLGGFVTMPGGSAAGKTIMALTALAEATFEKRFDKYLLIHDDAEERLSFDLNYLFGPKVEDRIACPPLGNSKTIQQFKGNVLTLQKNKSKFIYILDSFDSLSSDEELEKEMRKALAMAKSDEAAKKIAGSYGMEKAKIAGETLRMINNYLKESNSIILMTQQLRQNVGGGMFEPDYVTSGGEAPFFYSNHQIWLQKSEQLKKKDLVIGNHVRAKVVKNSATGKRRNVEFDIFYELGVDNVGSCVDFLIDEGYWKERTVQGTKGIAAIEIDLFEANRNKLIDAIEDKGLEKGLIEAVGLAWQKREDSIKLERKPRYA